jgi:membrane-associated phospholipid phosphatase
MDDLLNRMRAHWGTKLWLGILLSLVCCTGYFGLQHYPLRPAIRFSQTFIDQSIPFQPGWVWVYESLYLILPVAWVVETPDQMRRYCLGCAGIIFCGFLFFAVWPVEGPRPAQPCDNAMYRLMVQVDGPTNSFPSLHMALATYTAFVTVAVTSGWLRRVLLVIMPVWVALIGYSTMATKQHYWVDVMAGVALGWAAYFLAWRTSEAGLFADTGLETAVGVGVETGAEYVRSLASCGQDESV